MFMPLLLVLFLSLGANAHTGSSLSGAITISGLLKRLVMKNTIPLGGLTSYYGYEAINFPKSTPVYCYGGMALSGNGSIIGASFGGNVGKLTTVGKCNDPKDYLGGFLNIGLAYDLGKGSKDVSVQAAFSLGFDLKTFNQKLLDSFHSYNGDNRKRSERINSTALHFIKYAGRSSAKKLGKHYLWLKLLSLPLMTATGADWKNAINHLRFNLGEMKQLEKRQHMFAQREDIIDLFHNVKKDMDFYKCKGSNQACEKIYVDAYSLMDAIEDAMGSCHAVSLSMNLMSSYDVKIPLLASKLNYSFGYSYFGLREKKSAGKDTALAVSSAFASHRFWTKNSSCLKVEETAAESFGEFLGIMSGK